jgi:hypothetical protein
MAAMVDHLSEFTEDDEDFLNEMLDMFWIGNHRGP